MTPLEKSARAIAGALELDWQMMNVLERATFVKQALAAITALEPDSEMIAAAWAVVAEQKADAGIVRLGPGLGVREIFTAMLQSAINRKGER